MTNVKSYQIAILESVDANITFGFGDLFLWLIKPSNIPIFRGK